jgi:hypothetical protein
MVSLRGRCRAGFPKPAAATSPKPLHRPQSRPRTSFLANVRFLPTAAPFFAPPCRSLCRCSGRCKAGFPKPAAATPPRPLRRPRSHPPLCFRPTFYSFPQPHDFLRPLAVLFAVVRAVVGPAFRSRALPPHPDLNNNLDFLSNLSYHPANVLP